MALGPMCAQSVSPGDFFETKIRPVLANNCFACHNTKLKSGGLDLSSAAAFQQGAPSGPLISKEEPASSKLVQVLRYQSAIKMPPMGSGEVSALLATGAFVTAVPSANDNVMALMSATLLDPIVSMKKAEVSEG